MVVVDVNSRALETDRAQEALFAQQGIEIFRGQSVPLLKVMLTASALPRAAFPDLLVMTNLSVAMLTAVTSGKFVRCLIHTTPRAPH
jgi:hypothetical protein